VTTQTNDRQAEILSAIRRYKLAQLLLFYPALWGTLHLDDLDDMLAAQAASTFFDWCARRGLDSIVSPQGLTAEDKRAANSAAIEGDPQCQR
jgi:hypothetical protein